MALRACRDRADPGVLLSCIQPCDEAALVDRVAGVHVRLRLGGTAWPPQLLYRVYSHGTVTAMTFEAETSAPGTALSRVTLF